MPSWWWLVRSISGHFPSPGHSLHICRREAYFSNLCSGVIKWSNLLLSNQIKGVTTSVKNKKKKKSEQRWTLFLDKYTHAHTQAYIGVCVRVCVCACAHTLGHDMRSICHCHCQSVAIRRLKITALRYLSDQPLRTEWVLTIFECRPTSFLDTL